MTFSEHDPPDHQAATAALWAGFREAGPLEWPGVCDTTQGLGDMSWLWVRVSVRFRVKGQGQVNGQVQRQV